MNRPAFQKFFVKPVVITGGSFSGWSGEKLYALPNPNYAIPISPCFLKRPQKQVLETEKQKHDKCDQGENGT